MKQTIRVSPSLPVRHICESCGTEAKVQRESVLYECERCMNNQPDE
jgi:ribosomal protein L37AE/L43A